MWYMHLAMTQISLDRYLPSDLINEIDTLINCCISKMAENTSESTFLTLAGNIAHEIGFWMVYGRKYCHIFLMLSFHMLFYNCKNIKYLLCKLHHEKTNITLEPHMRAIPTDNFLFIPPDKVLACSCFLGIRSTDSNISSTAWLISLDGQPFS